VVTPEILDPSRIASELLVVVISPSKVLSESPVKEVQAATPYPVEAEIEIPTDYDDGVSIDNGFQIPLIVILDEAPPEIADESENLI